MSSHRRSRSPEAATDSRRKDYSSHDRYVHRRGELEDGRRREGSRRDDQDRDRGRRDRGSDRYRERDRRDREDRYRERERGSDEDADRSRKDYRKERRSRSRTRRRDNRAEDTERDKEGYRRRDRERDRGRDRERNPVSRSKDIERRPRSCSPPSRFKPKLTRGSRSPKASLDEPPKEKEKPNFNTSGALAAASNTLNNVVLKYTEPVDSRLPPSSVRYRLYTFKDGQVVGEPLILSTQTAWLIGRDRLVADIPVDHPSCSKQHAVIQFRHVVKKNEFGDKEAKVRPYIIDLESANGTMLNNTKVPESRYVELRDGDMLKFGFSTREYILMTENVD
ncbi:SMAD/FHA domain-containing protein [Kalaharituber pfeilii]|nr:SMAD/FHA domain-containing protein [Kalaharituber pfeilii]